MRKERLLQIAIPLAVFAATLALIAAPETTESGRGARDLDALAVLLAALTAVPLLAVRRAPLVAFMLSTTASTALFALDYPAGPPVGPTVALFFVAYTPAESRRKRLLTPLVVVVFFTVHVAAFGIANDTLPDGELLLGTIVFGGVWIAGERARLRRQRMGELEERARRAELEAERERKLAAAEERTRIARDLHDSAGHAINVILVQAGAARLHAQRDPDKSRAALATIETVARETLREIDQLVGALRKDADKAETPIGLAALETLVKRHRDAGLDVDVTVEGDRVPLPPAVDQAAYRILQESLTNAHRHGAGGAGVMVAYEVDALELRVDNAFETDGETTPGHGIVGMRERAQLLGGGVETHTVNGSFRVLARLPYTTEERT